MVIHAQISSLTFFSSLMFSCIYLFTYSSDRLCGAGSIVGIATGYGRHGPGIESQWGRDFLHLSRPALGPTQPPVQWVLGLSEGKRWPGPDADHSPPSSAMVMKEWNYTSIPPVGRTACTEPQCLYSRAISLLPLWAVRPVQSFSACTRVHFTLPLPDRL
jgi:hypothetical protein